MPNGVGRASVTFREERNSIEEFSEGDVAIPVMVNQREHLIDEHRVRLHGQRLSKLLLNTHSTTHKSILQVGRII